MSASLDGVPVWTGAAVGVLAYVVGSLLVLTMLFAVGGPVGDVAGQAPLATATFGYAALHAWALFYGLAPPAIVFSLLPATILAAAGYVVARRSTASSLRAPYRGVAVTVGYLPAAALGLLLAGRRFPSITAGETGVALVDALDPVLFALSLAFTGIVFPLLFGALGGGVAERRGF